MELAFCSPKWDANAFATLSVDNNVPYKSKATSILVIVIWNPHYGGTYVSGH
jgi:hypothetical protein